MDNKLVGGESHNRRGTIQIYTKKQQLVQEIVTPRNNSNSNNNINLYHYP